MRHLTSTLCAALTYLNLSGRHSSAHMGHSKVVSELIYQTPLAEVEITEVGDILRQFGMVHCMMQFVKFIFL